MELLPVVEGILFLVGDEGITLERLTEVLELPEEEVKELLRVLYQGYNSNQRGIQLEVLGNKFKLTTKKIHKSYYEKLTETEMNDSLSPAALETLAIIAYNQPITRMGVDEIRGINSGHLMRKLLLRNLIKDMGRADSPGRPILYGVTDEFLDYFGLQSIDELPEIEKIESVDEDTNLFDSKYKEEL